jgi:hypothetical protein
MLSLLILAGALMLLAASAPRANASLIAYYNFEGAATPPFPVNLDSDAPAFFSSGNDLILSNGAGGSYPTGNTLATPGLPLNVAPGDPDPNLTSLGIRRSGTSNLAIDIPLFSSQGFFETMTVSFALSVAGNGYSFVQLFYSIDRGGTFTAVGVPTPILTGGERVLSFAVPAAANNQPGLELRLLFTGGQSNGNNLQDQIDNIQVNGTIVPEPATVAGGLLGVLGLCWFQRRRLIRSVRFRRKLTAHFSFTEIFS